MSGLLTSVSLEDLISNLRLFLVSNSGYSNRYQELLRYLSKAGDSVEIVCPDDSEKPPKDFLSYPISYTPGFRFSLYNSICLSYDYSLVGVSELHFRLARTSVRAWDIRSLLLITVSVEQ